MNDWRKTGQDGFEKPVRIILLCLVMAFAVFTACRLLSSREAERANLQRLQKQSDEAKNSKMAIAKEKEALLEELEDIDLELQEAEKVLKEEAELAPGRDEDIRELKQRIADLKAELGLADGELPADSGTAP